MSFKEIKTSIILAFTLQQVVINMTVISKEVAALQINSFTSTFSRKMKCTHLPSKLMIFKSRASKTHKVRIIKVNLKKMKKKIRTNRLMLKSKKKRMLKR